MVPSSKLRNNMLPSAEPWSTKAPSKLICSPGHGLPQKPPPSTFPPSPPVPLTPLSMAHNTAHMQHSLHQQSPIRNPSDRRDRKNDNSWYTRGVPVMQSRPRHGSFANGHPPPPQHHMAYNGQRYPQGNGMGRHDGWGQMPYHRFPVAHNGHNFPHGDDMNRNLGLYQPQSIEDPISRDSGIAPNAGSPASMSVAPNIAIKPHNLYLQYGTGVAASGPSPPGMALDPVNDHFYESPMMHNAYSRSGPAFGTGSIDVRLEQLKVSEDISPQSRASMSNFTSPSPPSWPVTSVDSPHIQARPPTAYTLSFNPFLLIQRDFHQCKTAIEGQYRKQKLFGYLYDAWNMMIEMANKIFNERTRCRSCGQTPLTEASCKNMNHHLSPKALDLWKELQKKMATDDPATITMHKMEGFWDSYWDVERIFWEDDQSAGCAASTWNGWHM